MKNYLIKNTRGVEIFVNTDAPNDGREGIITSIQGLDPSEIRDFGFIYDVGDLFNEGDLINYSRANNFSITSLNQDDEVDDLFEMDVEFRFTITTTSANTVFTLPATSADNNFMIDWGDTNTQTITSASPTHTYATAGAYQIKINGLMPIFSFNNGGSAALVTSLDNMGDTGLENMNGFMYGCTSLTSADLNNFGTPFSVSQAFQGCTSLTTFTTVTFNTSRINIFNNFIRACSALTGFDCRHWDTSNVRSFLAIFAECSALVNIEVGAWDTSSGERFDQFFDRCTALTRADVRNWDLSNAWTIEWMFFSCSSLVDVDVSQWDVSSVRIMNWTFRACAALVDLPVLNWDVSNVRTMTGFINAATSLVTLNVSQWDVSRCADFWTFAEDASSLVNLPVGNWRFGVPSVRMARFIDNCDSIVILDVRDWNVELIDDFGGFARNSAGLTTLDTSQWTTAAGTRMDQIVNGCTALTSRMNPAAFWENTGITSFADAFTGATSIENFSDIPAGWRGG